MCVSVCETNRIIRTETKSYLNNNNLAGSRSSLARSIDWLNKLILLFSTQFRFRTLCSIVPLLSGNADAEQSMNLSFPNYTHLSMRSMWFEPLFDCPFVLRAYVLLLVHICVSFRRRTIFVCFVRRKTKSSPIELVCDACVHVPLCRCCCMRHNRTIISRIDHVTANNNNTPTTLSWQCAHSIDPTMCHCHKTLE